MFNNRYIITYKKTNYNKFIEHRHSRATGDEAISKVPWIASTLRA